MILLDTNAVLRWLHDKPSLSRAASSAIKQASARGAAFVSAITFWEVALLIKKGRLQLSEDARVWKQQCQTANYFEFLSVSPEIAWESVMLQGLPPDPADRIIVATAQINKMTLVTSDKTIIDSGLIETIH